MRADPPIPVVVFSGRVRPRMDSSELLVVIELVVLINPNLSLGRETDKETER